MLFIFIVVLLLFSSDTLIAAHTPYNEYPLNARSLGRGDTIVSYHPTDSSAYFFPAITSDINRPVIGFHYRYANVEQTFFDRQSLFVTSFEEGILDTQSQINSETNNISHAVILFPITRRLLGSVFYQDLVNTEGSHLFYRASVPIKDDLIDRGLNDVSLGRDYSLSTFMYGASLAFQVSEKLTLGFSGVVAESDFKLSEYSSWKEYLSSGGLVVQSGPFNVEEKINDTDKAFSYSIGFSYREKIPEGTFEFGLSFLRGFDFNLESYIRVDDRLTKKNVTYNIPQKLLFITSYAPEETLLFSMNLSYIWYDDSSTLQSGDPTAEAGSLSDKVQLNLGMEKKFSFSHMPFIGRFGVIMEPDHDGYTDIESKQIHFTTGLGVNYLKNSWLDIGLSYSDEEFYLILGSTVGF